MSKILILIAALFLSESFVCAQTAQDNYNKGLIDAQKNNFTQAISDCTKAIEISPNFVRGYTLRGIAYHIQGNFTQAISDYNKAIEIDPKDGYAYYYRAKVYYQLKEYDKSWTDVHKAETLGYKADKEDSEFLDKLKKASGK